MKKIFAALALSGAMVFGGLAGIVAPTASAAAETAENGAEVVAEEYGFSDTVDYSSLRLRSASSIASEITDAQNLHYVSADNDELAAANALYYIDEELNVVDASEKAIEPLGVALPRSDGKVIPNFYISTEEQLSALVGYVEENPQLTDAAVIAPDSDLIKSARKELPRFRAALDYSGRGGIFPAEAVTESNEAGALFLLLSSSQADRDTVNYIQSRMKAVWVKLDDTEEFEIRKGIASGAFGLVTDGDPNKIAEVYKSLEETTGFTVPRSPLNIAHRGDPLHYNENSMEGFIAACEAGATHLEVDAHLSADNQIVIMHDGSLSRTTNGSGDIRSMTLAEIKQYKIIRNANSQLTGEASEIPTADDLFSYCKDKDILLFFEIKTSESDFAKVFRSKIKEYGMEDKIVVISFDRKQLASVRENIPYLWALDLNEPDKNIGKAIADLCERNVGTDMPGTNVSPDLTRDYLDRGFPPAYWTYSARYDVIKAVRDGVYGITNNDAVACGTLAERLTAENLPAVNKENLSAEGFTLPAFVENFDGTKTEIQAEIFAWRDKGDYAEIILRGEAGKWWLLSNVARVEYIPEDNPETSEEGDDSAGCGSVAPTAGIFILSGLGFVLVGLRRFKRR